MKCFRQLNLRKIPNFPQIFDLISQHKITQKQHIAKQKYYYSYFVGFDHEDGTTDWYTPDGQLDSRSKTPHDDDDD